MLLNHYIPKIFTALFGGLFVFLGIYTFGEGEMFDRIYIAVLIFTGIICRNNINVVGVIAIIFLQRIFDEIGWYFLNEANGEMLRATFYLIGAVTYYKIKFDRVSLLLLASLILSAVAEIVWFITDQNAAAIHWFVFVLSLSLLARYFIFVRVSYTEDWFPNKAFSINLDWHIYKMCAIDAFVQSLMVLEYFIRNAIGLKKVMWVYNAHPYLIQAVSTYVIWIIFSETYKLLLPKLLKA